MQKLEYAQLNLFDTVIEGTAVVTLTTSEKQYLLSLCHNLPNEVMVLASIFKECTSSEEAQLELQDMKKSNMIQCSVDPLFLCSYQALGSDLKKVFLDVSVFLTGLWASKDPLHWISSKWASADLVHRYASRWSAQMQPNANLLASLHKLAKHSMVSLNRGLDGVLTVKIHDALQEFARTYVHRSGHVRTCVM